MERLNTNLLLKKGKTTLDMYNKYLEFLLDNDPRKVMSERGLRIRKILSPLVRYVIAPLSSKNKFHIEKNKNLPKDRPIIFAATHGLIDDIAVGLCAAGRHTYLLFASLPDFFGTIDGPALWLNGVILLDRKNKESRRAAKAKMEYAIALGADILMYPEGTLNKTENLIVQKLFPGIYDVAVKYNALVVPIAIIQEGKNVYAKTCDPFDICQYQRQEGLTLLRDLMASAKYELMERYSKSRRADIGNAKRYWRLFLDDLVNQVLPYYDFEIENTSQFIDKDEVGYSEAFEHLKHITPNSKTAFLFNKRYR